MVGYPTSMIQCLAIIVKRWTDTEKGLPQSSPFQISDKEPSTVRSLFSLAHPGQDFVDYDLVVILNNQQIFFRNLP